MTTRYTVEIIVRSAGQEIMRASTPFDHVHPASELEPWDIAPAVTRLFDFMEQTPPGSFGLGVYEP